LPANRLYWVSPACIWGLTILILTSIPSPRIPTFGIKIEDKFYHLIIYFVFGLLIMRERVRYRRSRRIAGSIQTLLFGLLFGIADEFHQYFIPGRSCDPWDATADFLGIAMAVVVFISLFDRLAKREKRWNSSVHGP